MILGYSRVSTQDQASDDRTSMEMQHRAINGLAMMRGVDPFSLMIYDDPGVSGTIPLDQRPAGRELLASVAAGDIVVASKLDRMFRSAVDALNVADTFKKRGIDLILLDMGSQPITSSGVAECFFTMVAAFAQLERTRIAERMTQGRKGKAERGGHIGGSAPYGHRVVGTGRQARLETVPEEQDIAQTVARLWRANPSPYVIAKAMNEKQLPTRSGKPWQVSQVQRIMARLS